ncbi:MAG: hypothetical protein IJX16_00285 [Clostridia bacterium]|nr:hypothetical protein [Clostridia bacterium]
MKVYIYRKELINGKRERFGIVENVIEIKNTKDDFLIYTVDDVLQVPKNLFMISLYGY